MKKRLIKLSLLLLATNSNVFAGGEGKENTVLKILNLKHNDGVTLNTVGSFLGKSADQLKSVVHQAVQTYPKTACVLGVAGLAAGGYNLYKKFANKQDTELLNSMFDDIDTSSLLLITGEPQENCVPINTEPDAN
jgi:hypothetical protein